MIPETTCYVGADVAQDTIAFRGFKAAIIENTSEALSDYVNALPEGAHLVCEATGRHHHALREVCAKQGRPLTVVNPAHARAFARSFGKLEKTDALDAELLRRFGCERKPPGPPRPLPMRRRRRPLQRPPSIPSTVASATRANPQNSPTSPSPDAS